MQSGGASSVDRAGPAWLIGALDAPFFTPCPEHSTGGFSHKTDRNFYCLDCHEDALCTFCVDSSHRGHDILQIRRASHNNAVRVNEIHQVNTEGVQQYTINGSKVSSVACSLLARSSKLLPVQIKVCAGPFEESTI